MLLAAELGPATAAAELERAARARYAGAAERALGVPAADVRRVAARLVTADDDAAIAAARRELREDAILAAAVQAALGAAAAIDGVSAVASRRRPRSGRRETGVRGCASRRGAEDGDVILCLDLDAAWRDLDPRSCPPGTASARRYSRRRRPVARALRRAS